MASDETKLRLVTLLNNVTDKDSFMAFVEALAKERERASQMEKENPEAYQWAGALGWENGSISSFLEAALAWSQDVPLDGKPSWRSFAEFLYAGKNYE